MSKLSKATILVPPWMISETPTSSMHCSTLPTGGVFAAVDYSPYLLSLQRFLPSNSCGSPVAVSEMLSKSEEEENLYESDEFMMYEFKVRRCPRGRSHDWTACPYAHPGEKARRRDPRHCHYSGMPCPEYRKGSCRLGDSCELAHGVFETWLHPSRYRTQPCNDGGACRRRVCFFAHSREELRVVQAASPRSPKRKEVNMLSLSPKSTLAPLPASPKSDCTSPGSPGSPVGMAGVMASMGRLRLATVGSQLPLGTPGEQRDLSSGFGSIPPSSGRNMPASGESEAEETEVAAAAPDFGWILDLVD